MWRRRREVSAGEGSLCQELEDLPLSCSVLCSGFPATAQRWALRPSREGGEGEGFRNRLTNVSETCCHVLAWLMLPPALAIHPH